MKVYVVKYALTQGIRVVEGEVSDVVLGRLYVTSSVHAYFSKDEWTTSPEKALQRAENKRQKRITSLRRQLDKMERLTFVVPKLTIEGTAAG